jgi:hypothetical protein
MSPSLPPSLALVTVAVSLAALAPSAAAQAPAGEGLPDAVADGVEARELARAKFEAVHADARGLARQRLEVARAGHLAVMAEFLAGRASLLVTDDWSGRLLDAERALATTPAERAAADERHWKWALRAEQVNAARYAAGRIPPGDYALSRYVRLGAEIEWIRARRGLDAGRHPGVRRGVRTGNVGPVLGDENPHAERLLARAEFEALRADPRDLARQQLQAVEEGYREFFAEFLAGRGALDSVLQWSERLADTAAALADGPAERAAAYRRHWAQTWEMERVNAARFAAARLSEMDYLHSRSVRIGAEIRWLRARTAAGGRSDAVREKGLLSVPGDIPMLQPETDDERELARARRAAERANPDDLTRERLTLAGRIYPKDWEEVVAGRGSLDRLLAASRQWLDAELALYADPAQQAAAWDRYWTRSKRTEFVNDARWRAGRVSESDALATRYVRLDAEIGWAEARARATREKP